MKQGRNVAVRILQSLGIGALIGGPIGFLSGYLGLTSFEDIISMDQVLELCSLGLSIIAGLLLVVVLYYLVQTNKVFTTYQKVDEESEQGEELYRLLNLRHSYTSTFNALLSIICILNLMLSLRLDISELRFNVFFELWPILGIAFTTGVQVFLLKRYNQMRGIEAPLSPTLKELKNNILEQDEAELEANYKNSFEIVMNLSGAILPASYILCLAVSFLTGKVELLAILITAMIHIYIMLKQFKMAKEFYR